MKRRGFLGLFGKAAAAIVAAPVLARVPPEVIGEGYTVKDGIRTDGSFAKTLWPHIKAEWEKTYADEQYFGLAQVKQEGASVPFDYNFKSSGLLPEQVDEYGLIAEYRKKELMASIAQRKKEYLESESAFENIFK